MAAETLSNYDIEITIDRTGEGTFWSHLNIKGKNFFTKIKEILPAKDQTIPIAIALIALLKDCDKKDNITIKNDYVIIDNSIKIDKNVYNTAYNLSIRPSIQSSVKKTFNVLSEDNGITAFAIAKSQDDCEKHNFLISINKEEFDNFEVLEEEDVRFDIRLKQTLHPIKVILEKSKRKWEFVWDGRRISAKVTCQEFYNKLLDGKIGLKPKDYIVATLKIKQKLDKINNVYINEEYEITEINDYIIFENKQINLLN